LQTGHGHVIERGTHGELVAAGGLYRELYERQFLGAGRAGPAIAAE
jgi:ABC-type multidrug transport system fused ATPase/permease subunit